MAYTQLGFSAPQAADAPTWSPALASLASGSVAVSSAIDNTVATLGHAAYDTADLWLLLTGGITVPAAGGYLQAVVIPSWDGTSTNYEVAGVNSGLLFPTDGMVPKQLLPSGAYPVIFIPRLRLYPALIKIALLNFSGAAFTATVSGTLYRYGGQAG